LRIVSSDYDSELVERARIHIKAKEFETARRFLERALDIADDPETVARASWLLSEITDDPARKRSLVEDVLSFNYHDAQARRALAILDGKLKPEEIIDPDKLAAAVEGEVQPARADRFTCPQCGARLVFSPDGRSLLCENCGYEEGPPPSPPKFTEFGGREREGPRPDERDFVLAMATLAGHRKPVSMHAFTCRGCGASLILPPEAISATCSYCGTPHVVDLGESRDLIEPDAIVPFAFERARAEALFSEWARRQNGEAASISTAPRGIYLPIWTFDLSGDIAYQAKVEVQQGNERRVWITRDTFPVLYSQVAVPATRNMGELLTRALSGYRLAEAVAYRPGYLADWPAEVYEIPMGDASLEARAQSVQRMKGQVAEHLQATYDAFTELTTNPAQLSVETFRLVLIPAWIASQRSGAQLRPLLLNGQTGRIYSEMQHAGPLEWLNQLFK
jgi:predicted RNA-binding Zn-ribbon protein involved in translation (DUF1610 family)